MRITVSYDGECPFIGLDECCNVHPEHPECGCLRGDRRANCDAFRAGPEGITVSFYTEKQEVTHASKV
jgi:hypothetical protein